MQRRRRYLYETDVVPDRTLRWQRRRERLLIEALAALGRSTSVHSVSGAESVEVRRGDGGPCITEPDVESSPSVGASLASKEPPTDEPTASLQRIDSGLAPSISSYESGSVGSISDECSGAEDRTEENSAVVSSSLVGAVCSDNIQEKEDPEQQSWSLIAEHDVELGVPLSPMTGTTKGDALLMCLAFGLRHGLSWKGMEDLMLMINNLFGEEVVRANKYFFHKYMEAGKGKIVYHLYCPYCEKYLGVKERFLLENKSCPCGKTVKDVINASTFFLSLDLGEQIQNLLRDKLFVEGLLYRFERVKISEQNYEDIYDGEIYKNLSMPGKVLSEKYNMSYMFNTDGFPVGGKSGKQTCWPIYIQINELHPRVRSKYTLLAGLYVGKKDPNMSIFLNIFVEQANLLATKGIDWYLDGKKINSKIIPLCACVDTPARHKILNTTLFNGRYGCSLCYTKPVDTTTGYRYPLKMDFTPERTHQEMVMDALQAHTNRIQKKAQKKIRVRGVRGPTPLQNLHYFDLVKCVRPDTMHSVLLGNARHFVSVLHGNAGKPFYIGSDVRMAAINERLLAIRPPSSLMRVPRDFNSFKSWQAKEWRSWLLFYAVPCLMDIIPIEYVGVLNLLASAIHITLRESISISDLDTVHILLLRYAYMFQQKFTITEMVVNVHLLLHLKKSIEYLGPAWTNVAFSFEGSNKYLLELKKGASTIAQEIAKKYLTFQSLPLLCQKYASSEKTLDFCQNLSGRPLLKSSERVGSVVLLGKEKIAVLDHEERLCLSAFSLIEPKEIYQYDRFVMKGIRYCIGQYSRSTKTDDSYVSIQNECRAQIHKILRCSFDDKKSIYLIVRELILQDEPIFNDEFGRHSSLHRVVSYGQLLAVTPEDISGQCIAMCVESGHFISDVPCGCYSDS